jgi:hypothetical protein
VAGPLLRVGDDRGELPELVRLVAGIDRRAETRVRDEQRVIKLALLEVGLDTSFQPSASITGWMNAYSRFCSLPYFSTSACCCSHNFSTLPSASVTSAVSSFHSGSSANRCSSQWPENAPLLWTGENRSPCVGACGWAVEGAALWRDVRGPDLCVGIFDQTVCNSDVRERV